MKIGYMLENQDTCNECFAKSMINLRKQSNGLDMVYFDDDIKQSNLLILIERVLIPGSILYLSKIHDFGSCSCEVVQRLEMINKINVDLVIDGNLVCIEETINYLNDKYLRNNIHGVLDDDDYISTNEIVDYVEKEPLTESLGGGDYYVSK